MYVAIDYNICQYLWIMFQYDDKLHRTHIGEFIDRSAFQTEN